MYRYKKWLEPKEPPTPKSRGSEKNYTLEEDRRLMRLRRDGMSWIEIEKRCLERTLKSLRARYWRLLAQYLDHPGQEFTSKEDECLMLLRDQEGHSWFEIKRRFPGRDQDSLRMHYSRLRSRYEWVMGNGFVLSKIPIPHDSNPRKRVYSEVASPENSCSKPKRRRAEHYSQEKQHYTDDDDDEVGLESEEVRPL